MSSMLQSNLNVLREYRFDLYERVIDYINTKSTSSTSIVQSTNGMANLFITNDVNNQIYMYSKYNPEHECRRWAESIEGSGGDSKHVIMYGLGLGYHLAAYIAQYPTHQLYIFEPKMEIFVATLNTISIAAILQSPNIKILAVGEDSLEQERLFYVLYTYASEEKGIVPVPFYVKQFTEKYQLFVESAKLSIVNQQSLEQYAHKLGKNTLVNTLRNFDSVLDTPSIKGLKGHLKGRKAIIIGSGPSLENEIELLKNVQEDIFLIAAGTSIQTLLHYGITPHLIVSMDAGEFNYKAFNTNDTSSIPLLIIPQINYKIVQKRKSKIIHAFFEHDPFIKTCFELTSDDPVFVATHSVTGTAIQSAVYMGCEHIILMGQDLSYPNNQIYSSAIDHLTPGSLRYTLRNMTETVVNVSGGTNPTTVKMKITLHNIEQLISQYSFIRFTNTAINGAQINGAEWKSFRSIIEQGDLGNYSRALFEDDIAQHCKGYADDYKKAVLDNLGYVYEKNKDISKRITNIANQISKLDQLSRTNPNKCLKTMANIELQWGEVIREPIFETVINEWMKSELYNFDRRVGQIAAETNLIKKSKLMTELLGTFILQLKSELQIIMNEIQKVFESRGLL